MHFDVREVWYLEFQQQEINVISNLSTYKF